MHAVTLGPSTPCTLGQGEFPLIRKPILTGFRYREVIIPAWLGQEILDTYIEDEVYKRIRAELNPLYFTPGGLDDLLGLRS
jgi:hypothetical protein